MTVFAIIRDSITDGYLKFVDTYIVRWVYDFIWIKLWKYRLSTMYGITAFIFYFFIIVPLAFSFGFSKAFIDNIHNNNFTDIIGINITNTSNTLIDLFQVINWELQVRSGMGVVLCLIIFVLTMINMEKVDEYLHNLGEEDE
jgi:hypothetical protein